eukprot:3857587-Rhodomonas_salina.2
MYFFAERPAPLRETRSASPWTAQCQSLNGVTRISSYRTCRTTIRFVSTLHTHHSLSDTSARHRQRTLSAFLELCLVASSSTERNVSTALHARHDDQRGAASARNRATHLLLIPMPPPRVQTRGSLLKAAEGELRVGKQRIAREEPPACATTLYVPGAGVSELSPTMNPAAACRKTVPARRGLSARECGRRERWTRQHAREAAVRGARCSRPGLGWREESAKVSGCG